jgi:hypothetical protein
MGIRSLLGMQQCASEHGRRKSAFRGNGGKSYYMHNQPQSKWNYLGGQCMCMVETRGAGRQLICVRPQVAGRRVGLRDEGSGFLWQYMLGNNCRGSGGSAMCEHSE